FGLAIRVIDGDEEARLSAQGVMMNGMEHTGVIGDYGGGSLEIISVLKGELTQKASLPIGSHRLQAAGDRAAQEKMIKAQLDKLDFLDACRGQDFYALGGAWRNMGKAHMRLSDHPFNVMD